ncbi:TonB C-terminal domain-containing protein [Candidatus Dependentiae bacterium]|nr:TonB C-terminal domain-containing protein [Candidatus Dependentiae bacterium]
MLHLLPSVLYSKVSERRSFLQNIFLFVFLLHIFIFVIPFLIAKIQYKHDKFTILMHQAGATYVLMPLQKRVDINSSKNSIINSDLSKKSQVVGYEEYLQSKKNAKKVSKKNSKADAVLNKELDEKEKFKKNRSRSSAILADKTYIKKKITSKKALRSKNKKNLHHKKKKKNKIKIIEQKQTEPIEVTQEVKTANEQQQIIKEDFKSEQLENDKSSALEEVTKVSDNVIFVGYEQFDECVIGSKIQHAIIQSWNPPVGLHQGISCEMKIKVSLDGNSDVIDIVKSSGILVFDMSARTALQEIEFPQEVYGKTIMIVLGN